MNFSPQQDAALVKAAAWLADPDGPQTFYLAGYAGTGKTTLALALSQGAKGRVLFAAYTGKAAYVMRQRGCANAQTIHQLIYKPKGSSTKYAQELKERLELAERATPPDAADIARLQRLLLEESLKLKQPAFALNLDSELRYAALVIIDECSMIDERVGQDLLSFGKKILVLGDPAQLPPVRGEGFFTGQTPDVVLTEIHRQARDNPIIQLATLVREGGRLAVGQYGASSVQPQAGFSKRLVTEADQVIVGRNATRTQFNRNFRDRVRGFKTPLPCVGDKLVCLRNNHDAGLLNGQLWEVSATELPQGDSIALTLNSETTKGQQVVCHQGIFLGNEIPWWARKEAEEFDYGYALTCHKAQGSQWNNVVVFDESQCFQSSARQWLYTAITRAAEKVTILLC